MTHTPRNGSPIRRLASLLASMCGAALLLLTYCVTASPAQEGADIETFREIAKERLEKPLNDAAEKEAAKVRAALKGAKAVVEAIKEGAKADAKEPDDKPAIRGEPAEAAPAKEVAAPDPAAPYERTLVEAKIEPTIEGIRQYLISLHPSADAKQQLEALIARLGDESFTEREFAMAKLRQRSAIAMEPLKAASAHADPEIRWRVKKLLENAAVDADAILFALCKTIEARQHKGLTAPLLVTLPLAAKDHVRFAARRALAATATPGDAALLQQSLKNADPYVRAAALGALANLVGKEAVDDALTLAADPDDRVRMAAARLLAQHGHRDSLGLLIALLDAKEIEIRSEAGRTLKAITGQDFGFVPFDDADARTAAREKWKSWHAADGQSAKLLLPLKEIPVELGRILLCSYSSSKVYEFDADARDATKPRWEIQMGMQPWAVQGLPDGRRLVAYYGGRKIVEFGPENNASKPVWESELLPGGPMGMHRLENGNTVVACTDAHVVVELDPQGKIAKKWPLEGRPVDVERLENGNTLVVLQNGQKVVEIDGEGKTVWSTKVAMINPFSAQRLENGNTLIAVLSQQKVIEVNRDGDREEWSLGGRMNPYHAERLSNGNTLVVDQNGIYEFDTNSKKEVWKLAIPHVSRASRF